MAYRMTPARRAALKRAQAASARKRRGRGKGKLAAANRSNARLRKAVKYASVGAGFGTIAAVSVGHAVVTRRVKQKYK